MTVLTVDGKDYMKGDEAFWKQNGPEGLVAGVGDRFVVTPGTMSKEINLGQVLDDIVATELTTMELINVEVEKVDLDGAPAYLVSQRVGTDDTKVWVSGDGQANLLKITGTDEDGPLSLTFSEWNTVSAFTAPPADQVADA